MLGPRGAEARDVVNVTFDVVKAVKGFFDKLLGDIRRLGDAHGEAAISIEAEGSGDGCVRFGGFVEFVCIKTLREIDLGEELVVSTAFENFLDTRNGVVCATDGLVEGSKVGDPTSLAGLLGNDETSGDPTASRGFFEDAGGNHGG